MKKSQSKTANMDPWELELYYKQKQWFWNDIATIFLSTAAVCNLIAVGLLVYVSINCT